MNIVAIDQEGKHFVMTVNGSDIVDSFDPANPLVNLPPGGGIIVGDGNCWKASNGKSKSQFLSQVELDWMRVVLRDSGWRCITVANKLANTVQARSDYERDDAVIALGQYATELVARNGSFDSGHEVRESHGDISFGHRGVVTNDFLIVQNSGGYESAFMADVIKIAFDALAKDDRPLFDLKKTMAKVTSPRRLAAIAVAVYDPWTGQLRQYNGKPWGMNFITRRVIGLSGAMRGTGEHAPGNPMRAALRFTGKRNGYTFPINREERAYTDKLIRQLIRAFQDHGSIHPVETEA